jgi:leucyl/phenylalanyl-tRNA--protein transferase
MAAIDPALLLRGYAAGVFPMGEARDDDGVHWIEPQRRAVLPLDGFHLARSLRKTLLAERYRTTANVAFDAVVAGCAQAAPDRDETWINAPIATAVRALHARGHAHSIESWAGDELVGGLYGVSLGRAFFGESMFSRATDASKVALAHLVARLRGGGFVLLDCQFMTDHLASLGAVEVSRAAYRVALASALRPPLGDFAAFDSPASAPVSTTVSGPTSGWRIVHSLTQTSQTGCSTTLSDGDSL